MSEVTQNQLRDALVEFFDLDELRFLCSDLEVNYDSFSGDNLNTKALSIATWSYRHGRMDDLAAIIKRERPFALEGTNISPAPPGLGSNTTGSNPQPSPGSGNIIIQGGTFVGANIGSGTLHATNIAGRDININEPDTTDEFKAQLAELQKLVDAIVADNDFTDSDTVVSDLKVATNELDKEQPKASRIQDRLETVKEILDKAAHAVNSASKTAVALANAAAMSGVLYETATKLFS